MAIKVTDPVYNGSDKFDLIETLCLKVIKDRRDVPFLILISKVLIFVVPFAVCLFLVKELNVWICLGYLGTVMIYFLGPVTLMLHNTSHRPLFRRSHVWLNSIIPWFICLFFGQSPETYYVHHIGMHHVEENFVDDLSTTIFFQRDSVWCFFQYIIDFFVLGPVRLLYYMKSKGRKKLFRKVLSGELSFLCLTAVLSFVNFKATLIVFILPFFVTRFAMLAGNWAQHAFIDPTDPTNPFKNSITCINSLYNKRCFNDGYHIGHHLNSSLHWSEMPTHFLKNQSRFVAEQAIVFQGLDYFQIWLFLMLKKYDRLADHLVRMGSGELSQEEKMALLRLRTKPLVKAVAAVEVS